MGLGVHSVVRCLRLQCSHCQLLQGADEGELYRPDGRQSLGRVAVALRTQPTGRGSHWPPVACKFLFNSRPDFVLTWPEPAQIPSNFTAVELTAYNMPGPSGIVGIFLRTPLAVCYGVRP